MKSLIQDNSEICFLCGKRIVGTKDEHHIFNGANRKKSDEDGMVVYLHRTCHQWLHEHPISMNTFKQRGQRVWESIYGSRKDFIKRYRKNYLED